MITAVLSAMPVCPPDWTLQNGRIVSVWLLLAARLVEPALSAIDVLASWFVVIVTVDCSVLLRQPRIPPDMTQTSPK